MVTVGMTNWNTVKYKFTETLTFKIQVLIDGDCVTVV